MVKTLFSARGQGQWH